ncbi:MAG: hypothetical protein GY749_14250 [Desulfobacteraceae bacterium]|nr:hypothetical protein [Desulfobacteraceae bacterium]MCP4353681.1 hypothetical protein [Desulfobacterales bacterium]
MLNFKECTLVKLEKSFALEQIRTSSVLEDWINGQADITDFEQQVLLKFREKLRLNVYDWNETELAYNFIGPVIALADYTTSKFNFFAERTFCGIADGIEMGGRPDGMVASGFREPEKPYFCFQEYKKEKDPGGDPAAQALAPMLVAQEINEYRHPIYGCYVKGGVWYFMTLLKKQYCISDGYLATRDDIFDIFRILKVLKLIIIELAKN